MANVIIDDTNLVNIANAIREKNGSTDTYKPADMSQAILDIVSGGSGGIEYTSIVYNDDDTITLTDTDGNEHIIVCEYDGDKLMGATYDGKVVELAYEGDGLTSIGKTGVDLSNAPLARLTTIKAEGCVAEVVLPVTIPTALANTNSNITADCSASLEE